MRRGYPVDKGCAVLVVMCLVFFSSCLSSLENSVLSRQKRFITDDEATSPLKLNLML